MDWIDDTVAVGNWIDGVSAQRRRNEDVDLIIDSRVLFTKSIIPDRRLPLVEKLLQTSNWLVEISSQRPRVLIYCNQGRDRSAFVAMLYVSKRYGISYQKAYGLVKSKRKQAVFHWEWAEAIDRARTH
jgi:protein-tyrosine phosphatase